MNRFDEVVNRRGTNSYKWDSSADADVLPLWVADMDFKTAPCIIEALQRRVEHGIFGYVRVPDSYYDAVTGWFEQRHGWCMQPGDIIYTSGVVPAVSAIIQAMTEPGDKVLVQTPVYNCFFSSIRNNDCVMQESPLCYADNTYHIDFEDFERKASDPRVKLFLLCNPHNPAGRVWTRDELTRMGEICLRHNVFIVSDEIHNELVMPGHTYVPFASISDDFARHSAICTSPSKSFNIAGLQIANITVADADIRARIDKSININEVCDVNPFGVEALQAAYSEQGAQWLAQLLDYLHGNYQYLRQFFAQHLPMLPVCKLEGTYLVWVDCSVLKMESQEIEEDLLHQQHLWLNSGQMYDPTGSPFMRINIACPRSTLEQALKRLRAYIIYKVQAQ